MSKFNINEKIHLIQLFYCYKNLLTKKQISYFELYFEEDLSFQEIANENKVSKAAISDAINKIILLLKEFEDKLHINKQQMIIKDIIKTNEQTTNQEVKTIIKKLGDLE